MSALTTSLRVNNDLTVAELADLAAAAERAGIDQLWVSNDLMLRSAPVLVGYLAARTARIGIGIGIMNPFTVHPAELAMIAATAQEASGGRFLLGIAAGAAEFLEWVGIRQERPLTRTREALRALRALLSGQPADTVEGWTEHAHLRFASAPVPLYVGATSPRMLEFAGAEADGVLALALPPTRYAPIRESVLEGAARAGRTPEEIDLPACIWLSLDDDRAAAERALAAKIAYYGSAFAPHLLAQLGLAPSDFGEVDAALHAGDAERAASLVTDRMLQLGIAGDAPAVIERCTRLIDEGARHISFGPPLGPDPVAAVERIGADVIPHLVAHTRKGQDT